MTEFLCDPSGGCHNELSSPPPRQLRRSERMTRDSENGGAASAEFHSVRVADLYGQSLPDLIVVSGRIAQDHHDHSAQ
jgi:hypothetical protein